MTIEIIQAAIKADKAALMNRLHHIATQSKADALATFSAAAYNAAMARHDAACNSLNNVYWEDVNAIEADCAQYVITLHEAGKIIGATRDAVKAAAAARDAAR